MKMKIASSSSSSSSSSTNPLFPSSATASPALTFTSVPIITARRLQLRSKSQSKPLFSSSSTTTRAVDPETNSSISESDITTTTTPSSSPTDGTDNFENRLSQLRVRYRSGTGKKADARKGKRSSSKKGGSRTGVFLPPVPLKEAVAEGLKVDFGFSPYTERLNGRLAALGLAAMLLVELGSGKSVISYHTPPVVLIQIYTVAALSALYVKYQKEKFSIWP
ncbi:hypothetical protein NE237_010147 [Protea cynaroides]|uniref:Uncharacterized protein n=1 Tax=Protea cynaroides TaxID=273540 RepID=A0A9Q0KZ41_9MAGN|nr:hypothetical protein NE237_010147 [Protea cynaroides]